MQSLVLNPNRVLGFIGRHLAKAQRSTMRIPFLFIQDGEDYYCLRVAGDSMLSEKKDGDEEDVVLVKRTENAKNGDIIVGVVDGQPMLKKYQKFNGQVELHSTNSMERPIVLTDENDFRVAGIFVGHFKE